MLQNSKENVYAFLVILMEGFPKKWKFFMTFCHEMSDPPSLSALFNNFRQKILYFDVSRQKRVLFNCYATKQCLGMLKM